MIFKKLLISTGLSILSFDSVAVEAVKASESILVDGIAKEKTWQRAPWYPINHLLLGDEPSREDFYGRYKLSWDQNYLYILAEITDDVLFDSHPNPLEFYWDDDCLEVFIDEDASGGDHENNFNAFAYHIALDNQVVDIGPRNEDGSTNFVLLNEHLESRWNRSSKDYRKLIWEVAVKIYDDSFKLNDRNQKPVKLMEGKSLGFMLAYCDNDGSQHREHFVGSHYIKPKNGDKNLGYKDASVFGTLKLLSNEK